MTAPTPLGTTTEELVALLDRLEASQDEVSAAHKRKYEVTKEIQAALGMDGYPSEDKLTAALLRALVKARQTERTT